MGVLETMKKETPPWEKKLPKNKTPTKLTPKQKAKAKQAAKKAGRPYPNLVDNMNQAKKKGK